MIWPGEAFRESEASMRRSIPAMDGRPAPRFGRGEYIFFTARVVLGMRGIFTG